MRGQSVQRLVQSLLRQHIPTQHALQSVASLRAAVANELPFAARCFSQAASEAALPNAAVRWQAAAIHRGFASFAAQSVIKAAPRHAGAAPATAIRQLCSAAAVSASTHGQKAWYRSIAAGVSDGTARQLALWLGVTSGWVASMVVLGGVTRLTRSGLSMTDWKFTGEKPPQTQSDWEAEFAKYKQSPEYKRVNLGMNLDDFKFIFWMEYAHRMWGRILGFVFAVPAAYFVARGAVTKPLASRLGLLFLMGGTQGLVGWWMVKSGLQEPEKHYDTPRVSPYRLAAHLASAFSIYAVLMWTTLSLTSPVPVLAEASPQVLAAASKLRRLALPLAGLVAVTAGSGAFVAGLDAGHAYNTFPLMGGRIVPEEYWFLPGWRNAFENTAAVQFHHRVLALSTLAAVTTTWMLHRQAALPPSTRNWLNGLLAVTVAQVTLGISTLLTYVPVSLGSAHQTGALALFTVVLGLLHSLRRPTTAAPLAAKLFTPAAAASTIGVWAVVLQAPKEAADTKSDAAGSILTSEDRPAASVQQHV